jgi:enamine deaminase RidA (YjgF/YER057c/UK114 family)
MIDRRYQTKIMHRAVLGADVIYFGGVVADDLSAGMFSQMQGVCAKVERMLKELGSSKEKLLQATLYITDMSLKNEMNEAWTAWLSPEHLPARATIGVADLGEGVLVEAVVTARQ